MKGRHQGNKRKKFDNLIFGRQPVIELLQSGKTIDKILIQSDAEGDIIFQLKKLAAKKDIPVKHVPAEKLNMLTGGIHQGVIAFTSEIEFSKIENILPYIIEQGKIPLFILLDAITDVRNFGAIARTAYAAGVDALLIPFNETAPANAEAIKASAGALIKIPVCREKNISHMLHQLKLNGLQIIGADAKAEKLISQANLEIPSVIILGSEEEGISYAAKKYIDEYVSLPALNNFDSYNVSVAAGMILYEVMKQRNNL